MRDRPPVLLLALDERLAAGLTGLLAAADVGAVAGPADGDALAVVESLRPKLLVADLSRFPGRGEVFCRQVSRLPSGPLILALVNPGVEPAVAALRWGAATCLGQPVSPHHLAAQVLALLRAAPSAAPAEEPLVEEVGGLRIDRGRRRILVGGRPLPLTPTEYRLLTRLARTPGQVVSPSDLIRECAGLSVPDREAMDLLKVHVYRLRRKLKLGGANPETLRSARGFGYLLDRRGPGGPLHAATDDSLRESA